MNYKELFRSKIYRFIHSKIQPFINLKKCDGEKGDRIVLCYKRLQTHVNPQDFKKFTERLL